jgi:hypothetical protein
MVVMAANTTDPAIVFAADLHFDETGAWKYRGITGDAQHSFAQVVDFCCRHRAGVLALGGDIVDRPDAKQEVVEFLYRQVDRLHQAGIPVVYILGQHDGRQRWASMHPAAIHLHGLAYDVDEFAIYGLDYHRRPEDFLAAYAALQPRPGAFLLCHQDWREFLGGRSELAMAQLPFAIDLLTGDDHQHRTRQYQARDGSTAAAFSPGSTHVRDVAEEESKRFFAFYRGTLTPYGYRSIPLATRPVRRYQVTTPDEAEAFLARTDLPLDGEGVARAVIDVAYYDDLDGFAARLDQALKGRCHLFSRPRKRPRDERTPSPAARRAVADRGLVGAVPLVCEPGPVRDSAERLLAAPDMRVELAAMAAEFYGTPESTDREEIA